MQQNMSDSSMQQNISDNSMQQDISDNSVQQKICILSYRRLTACVLYCERAVCRSCWQPHLVNAVTAACFSSSWHSACQYPLPFTIFQKACNYHRQHQCCNAKLCSTNTIQHDAKRWISSAAVGNHQQQISASKALTFFTTCTARRVC